MTLHCLGVRQLGWMIQRAYDYHLENLKLMASKLCNNPLPQSPDSRTTEDYPEALNQQVFQVLLRWDASPLQDYPLSF